MGRQHLNPWIGCTKISPACDHCYAEAQMDTRMGRVKWGAGQPVRPQDSVHKAMIRVGKRAAGRLLDGVEHNGVPA